MSAVLRQGIVAALGETELVHGYGLAGVRVVAAESAQAVRAAWPGLCAQAAVVILTPAAADALGALLHEPGCVPTAVIPR